MVNAAQATRRVLAYLEQRISLREHEGKGRGPWSLMAGAGATRGSMRCFSGDGLDKLVFLTLEDDEQLDATMLMAFSAPSSPVPHLVLDAARVGRDYAVFVDLVQRVDLAINPGYAREVYVPLVAVREGLKKHPQLHPLPLPASLLPFVSPWMTGFRVAEGQLAQLFELVAPFVSHWVALQQDGLRGLPLQCEDLAARDLSHRGNLFSKEADPVWDVLGTLVGETSAARVLEVLRRPGIPSPPSAHPPAG